MPRTDLGEYRRKRDFAKTPEPDSGTPAGGGPLTFVVHKHDASRLHYDLRIECGGVLMSFPVPKGPSAKLGEKRLAVRSEDHPLDYAAFEGVIPAGQYGAGSSIIWDAGTYAPDEPRLLFDDRGAAEAAVQNGLEKGKLSLTFRGRKLKGSWALVKTKDAWLLLKHRDAAANPPVELTTHAESVLSGKTNSEIAREGGATREREMHFAPQSLKGARAEALKEFAPMLASAGKPIPAAGWSYEPKLDGIRALSYVRDGEAKIVSRGGHDITAAYPGIAEALGQLPASALALDGEIVAVNEEGRPSFELLQRRMNLQDPKEIRLAEASVPATYYVFDVPHLDGYNLAAVPLEDRREVLARVLVPGDRIRETATIPLPPAEAFEAAVPLGFEGIIAKRDGSRYQAGKRGDSWRKWKALSRGVYAIGGWTKGEGSRAGTFGGLLLGERTADGLIYRGRVGSGFGDTEAKALRTRLDDLRTDGSPFVAATPEGRKATYVRPEIEVEVEFAEQTSSGVLRAPVFKRFAPGPDGGSGPQEDEREALLEQLARPAKAFTLEGDGWTVGLTNLDKELWPAEAGSAAVTKRELLRHAIQAWPYVEPLLRDRLLTLTRYPNGIGGTRFYQKHVDAKKPEFVETVRVFSETDGKDKEFILCNNLATLVYFCQQAALEWHMNLARVTPAGEDEVGGLRFNGSAENVDSSVLNHPDVLVFDLDSYVYAGDEKPGEEPRPNRKGFEASKRAANATKELLDELGLPSFLKTSGKTGLHIFVPITRTLDFDSVRAFATTLGNELVRRHPRLLTTEWQSKKRTGKVFVDVNQNGRARAMVAPFSPRAYKGAPVSVPVAWAALESLELGEYTIANCFELLAQRGPDPWARFGAAPMDLRKFLGMA